MTESRPSLIDDHVATKRWQRTKLRGLLDRVRDDGHPHLPLLSANLPVGVVLRNSDDGRLSPSLDRGGYLRAQPGDLVMNPLGKPHGSLGVSKHLGITSPAYFVARPRAAVVEPGFLHHLLRSRLYISEYERVGKWMPPSQFNIAWRQFTNIPVYLPPLSAQSVIAEFLDRETGRIDDLVAKKRQLIELLEERRIARIGQAVTKGLDESVSVRDSESSFLGEIPNHWATLAIRRVAAYRNSNVDKKSSETEIPVLLCNYTDVYHGSYLRSSDEFMAATATQDEIDKFRLRIGSVIITKDSETADDIGIPAYVAADIDAVCGYHLTVLDADSERMRGDYLYWVLASDETRAGFEVAAQGVTRYGLTANGIGSALVPVPPLDEQLAIARTLEEEGLRVRSTVTKITRQIDLLAEYRQALVTAAVTGEIDISGEIPDPEEAVA